MITFLSYRPSKISGDQRPTDCKESVAWNCCIWKWWCHQYYVSSNKNQNCNFTDFYFFPLDQFRNPKYHPNHKSSHLHFKKSIIPSENKLDQQHAFSIALDQFHFRWLKFNTSEIGTRHHISIRSNHLYWNWSNLKIEIQRICQTRVF